MRCAVLWRTAWADEGKEWAAQSRMRLHTPQSTDSYDEGERMGKEYYRAYSKAGRAAEKAEKLARDLGIDGLQARAWYWRGRADGGRRYWDEASAAFRRAMEFDTSKLTQNLDDEDEVGEYGRTGLTPWERRDVEALRMYCEKRDEREQCKRMKSFLAIEDGDEDGDEDENEVLWGEEGFVDVAEEYPEFRSVAARVHEKTQKESEEPLTEEEQEYVDFMHVVGKMKVKYKTRPFKPFNPEEQECILHGTEGKRMMGWQSEVGRYSDTSLSREDSESDGGEWECF